MDIAKNPPCAPNCPSRGMGCHSGCEKYADWKAQLSAITEARRREKIAAQDATGLAQERKDWLRKKGYKTRGGAR